MNINNQKGFAKILVLIILIVVAIAGYIIFTSRSSQKNQPTILRQPDATFKSEATFTLLNYSSFTKDYYSIHAEILVKALGTDNKFYLYKELVESNILPEIIPLPYEDREVSNVSPEIIPLNEGNNVIVLNYMVPRDTKQISFKISTSIFTSNIQLASSVESKGKIPPTSQLYISFPIAKEYITIIYLDQETLGKGLRLSKVSKKEVVDIVFQNQIGTVLYKDQIIPGAEYIPLSKIVPPELSLKVKEPTDLEATRILMLISDTPISAEVF